MHSAIIGFAMMDPIGYAEATNLGSYVFGGIGYVCIIAMTATSINRTAAEIGPARLAHAAPCRRMFALGVCPENLIRVDDLVESIKLVE